MGINFGAFSRNRRRLLGVSLAEVVSRTGLEPMDVRGIEAGAAPPPEDDAVLRGWAEALKIDRGSRLFARLAALARGGPGEVRGCA